MAKNAGEGPATAQIARRAASQWICEETRSPLVRGLSLFPLARRIERSRHTTVFRFPSSDAPRSFSPSRTVGEVLPAVTTNKQGISGLKEQLQKQFESKKEELKAFQEKYKITVRGEESSGQQQESTAQGSSAGGNQGILA